MAGPDRGLRPPIFADPETYLLSESQSNNSVFPFAIRWQDEHRWNHWLETGFGKKEIVSLGTVGSLTKKGALIEPGIRIIAAVAQLAQVAQTVKNHGLGTPLPVLFYPAYINATANSGSVDLNLQYASLFHDMAERYFEIFHPDLPSPQSLVDQPSGVEELEKIAPNLIGQLQPQTIEEILQMALNHNLNPNISNPELIHRSVLYLLAHYLAYGWGKMSSYVTNGRQRLFVVPQSEAEFQTMLEREFKVVSQYIPLTPLTDNEIGDVVLGFSNTLRTPHYYAHVNEPSIMHLNDRLRTRNELAHKINSKGINGSAQTEIWTAIEYLIKCVGKDNIPILMNKVILPYKTALIELSNLL